jgi:hypothetical protein
MIDKGPHRFSVRVIFAAVKIICHCEERSDAAISGVGFNAQLIITPGIPTLRSE